LSKIARGFGFQRMLLIVLHGESAASEIKDPNNSFHTFDVLNHPQPADLDFAFQDKEHIVPAG